MAKNVFVGSNWNIFNVQKNTLKMHDCIKGFLLFYPIKTNILLRKFNIFFFSNVHFLKHYVHFTLSI